MLELFRRTWRKKLDGDPSVSVPLEDNPLYLIQARGIRPSVDNQALVFSSNLASIRKHRGTPTSNSTSYAGSNSADGNICSNAGNGPGESVNYNMFIPHPGDGNLFSTLFGSGSMVDSVLRAQHLTLAAYHYNAGTPAVMTNFDLAMSSGNFASGRIDRFELALHRASDVGKTFGKATLLQREVGAGQSFIDLLLTGRYRRYVVVQLGVVLETDGATLNGRVGTAAGVQAGDYKSHTNASSSSAATYDGLTSATRAVQIKTMGNVGGECASSIVEIPSTGGAHKIVSAIGAGIDTLGNAKMCNGAGAYTDDTDALTVYRAIPTADNIDEGTFLLFGIDPIVPTWKDLPTQFPRGEEDVIIDLPTTADRISIDFDLMQSEGTGTAINLYWRIGGVWIKADATHLNLSSSNASSYAGSTTVGRTSQPGNDTGENFSGSIEFSNLQSTTLYPVALQQAGYIDTGGNVKLARGAHAEKTAGRIDGVKFGVFGSVLSGSVRTSYLEVS